MNGELAQLIALAAHANAYLADRAGAAPELAGAHSTFQFVSQVEFRDEAGTTRGTAQWFERLGNRGAVSIIVVLPNSEDASLSAFANATPWRLRVLGRAPAEWAPTWEWSGDDTMWKVVYERVPLSDPTPPADDIEAAAKRLVEALDGAEALSRRLRLGFIGEFRRARHALGARQPKAAYHADLLPATIYSLDARRLLAAASEAWVFGGMGSWNDASFADASSEEDYRRITEALYGAVLSALGAAVNTFDGLQIGGTRV